MTYFSKYDIVFGEITTRISLDTPQHSHTGGHTHGHASGTHRGGFRRFGGVRKRFGAQHGTSSGERGSFRGRRFGGRGGHGGNRGGRRAFGAQYIDPSRFVQSAVVVEEAPVYIPEHQFIDFPIDSKIKANLTHKGYQTPTPIQDKAIPHVLHSEDVVGIADTGTGKTAAFLVPLLHRHIDAKGLKGKVIIVAPTRELAVQIQEELRTFARGLGVRDALIVGGASMGKQISDLRNRPAFVIGTPGRIKDLIQQKRLILNDFSAVVLDEADRMLDMGFIHDVRFIVEQLPSERQTLLFTATLPREIENLIGSFLKQPVRISVKTGNTSKNVHQDVIHVPHGTDKFPLLVTELKKPEFKKVIVFGRTKWGVQKLSNALNKEGVSSEAIHGDKTHAQRLRALTAFKAGKVYVLCATDVAARGIDVSGVTHVINYDQPATYEDYVHRIGRTGRAGKTGHALTFVEGR